MIFGMINGLDEIRKIWTVYNVEMAGLEKDSQNT